MYIPAVNDFVAYNILGTTGFPFDVVTDSVGSAGSCVIPVDMEKNVTQLHNYLFEAEEYTPSETVVKISDKIKNDTGIY